MPTIYKNGLAYNQTFAYGGFTPVGTIIAIMSNDAPTHREVICTLWKINRTQVADDIHLTLNFENNTTLCHNVSVF